MNAPLAFVALGAIAAAAHLAPDTMLCEPFPCGLGVATAAAWLLAVFAILIVNPSALLV